MPTLPLRTELDEFAAGFARVRAELEIPDAFPADVLAETLQAIERGPQIPPGAATEVIDRRDLPLVTIDPPGSRDLDQAFAAEPTASGHRVFYAIADVAAFVAPDGALDTEARARGLTLYSPDTRTPLHPEILSEDAASLLPGADRQALLWTIDLDERGETLSAELRRSVVRSREQLSYREAQDRIDGGDEALGLLRTIGERRLARERERDAVSLDLPAQEIVERDGRYTLVFDETLPVERWNAQISLLTGIAAADIMLDGAVGLLRTLPAASEETIAQVRSVALALGIAWPDDVGYAERVRDLHPTTPAEVALLAQSARALRGAGYVAFDGERPDAPGHAAIAASYAHVTAPLRRLCDRFANEVVLALCAGVSVPTWVRTALPDVPSLMGRAVDRSRRLERAMVDYAEARLLASCEGTVLDAIVTGRRDDTMRVQIEAPAVVADMADDGSALGTSIRVTVASTDPDTGTVTLTSAP